ncbi:MAG: uroporphyrinogen-III synthase [Pantanalinema sp. GBBB05]|nr:uroporphyrinogen-III synthase [Pantanalinema sp. GBBB05]
MLTEAGATVIEMPTLEIGPPSSWDELDDAIAHLDDFDWLILTSTNAVDYFIQRLREKRGDDVLVEIQVAVVGEKTAARLEQLGIRPDFIPPDFIADSLVANFPERLNGLRILFPRVESGGRDILIKEFTNQGATVRQVAAYESGCPTEIDPVALAALRDRQIDIVTFASSKTVKHFCLLLYQAERNDAWKSWLENVCIASIGPQTSQACEALLGRVDVEPREYTLDGLVEAIAEYIQRSP